MSLISFSFILFTFILIGLYFLVPGKLQWIFLLIASMAFYLSNGWRGIIYVLITILTQYWLAIALDNQNRKLEQEISRKLAPKSDIKKKYAVVKKKYVLLAVVINVGILCYVKYTNFFLDSFNMLFRHTDVNVVRHLDILVPLGISFYTFQSLGYIIDVYRGKVRAERNIFKFALFISYFPTIIQGPIERFGDLEKQLYIKHSFDYTRVTFGLQRMLWGYIKKLVIAERAAVIVDEVFGKYDIKGYYGLIVLLAAILYAFQIYADFSGGMDIVCGLSEVFGIKLTENFRRPYLAGNVTEFWQRWHITLGAWMRNYLFYPISLSSAFNKLNKKCRKIFGDKTGRVLPTSLASFIVFVIVGIWHGANWKFVVYGIYQAIFVSTGTLCEELYVRMRNFFKVNIQRFSWRLFVVIRTFFILSIGRYFSRADSVGHAMKLLKATISGFNPWVLFDGSLYKLGLDSKDFGLMIISILVLIIVDICQEKGVRIRKLIAEQNIVCRWTIYYGAIFSLIIFGMYGPGYEAASFIYQQF